MHRMLQVYMQQVQALLEPNTNRAGLVQRKARACKKKQDNISLLIPKNINDMHAKTQLVP